jgi:hypothetical protein
MIRNVRRISPGTGKTRSPIVHSPFVPALPPIGGRPPTSTILNTSTSSETSPLRACAMLSARAFNWATSPEMKVSRGGGGRSLAWERVRRRVARFSRKARMRCLATGKFRAWSARVRINRRRYLCRSLFADWRARHSVRGAFPVLLQDPRVVYENHLWYRWRQ